jgi:hypothetical protein
MTVTTENVEIDRDLLKAIAEELAAGITDDMAEINRHPANDEYFSQGVRRLGILCTLKSKYGGEFAEIWEDARAEIEGVETAKV